MARGNTLTHFVHIRLSTEQREKLQAAADLAGLNLSAWIRQQSLLAADVVDDTQVKNREHRLSDDTDGTEITDLIVTEIFSHVDHSPLTGDIRVPLSVLRQALQIAPIRVGYFGAFEEWLDNDTEDLAIYRAWLAETKRRVRHA